MLAAFEDALEVLVEEINQRGARVSACLPKRGIGKARSSLPEKEPAQHRACSCNPGVAFEFPPEVME